jgi:tetratricopeptide (TPR) repeat protein
MNPRIAPVVVALVAVAVVAAWLVLGSDEEPPVEPTPAAGVEEEAAPDAGIEGDLSALRQEAEALGVASGSSAAREEFITHARTLGEAALQEARPDVTAQVGDLLIAAGEVDFAGAVLQRAVGLMKPEETGEDHLYALARVRRAQRRPIEAASLFERAVHTEPNPPAEFVGLSEHYLAADRMGPARAAVTRGLRLHPGHPTLRVQGAEVATLSGDPAAALAELAAILEADPTDLAARLTRLEALLAVGEIQAATDEAAALRDELPDEPWGWIYGAAAVRATGGQGTEMIEQAYELAGDCPCTREERLGIEWAETVKAGPQVTPRSRIDQAETPASAPTPAPAAAPE